MITYLFTVDKKSNWHSFPVAKMTFLLLGLFIVLSAREGYELISFLAFAVAAVAIEIKKSWSFSPENAFTRKIFAAFIVAVAVSAGIFGVKGFVLSAFIFSLGFLLWMLVAVAKVTPAGKGYEP